MAAPTATTRVAPGGLRMDDGYSTKVTIGDDPDISIWEKTVTPPGFDGGDEIDTSTMHNTTWRTFEPRALITLTELSFVGAYDAAVLDQILLVINVKDDITITFPNGDTWAFYGFLKMFDPQEHSEGSQPEANVTIVPTNFDSVNNVEAGPNFVSAAGTD